MRIYFASQIRAKVSQFKTQLNNTKKGALSIDEYLLKIRNLVDLLAMVGEETKPKDHIEYIYRGLPEEYENFIMNMDTRAETLTVVEIESLLLTQESRIERKFNEINLQDMPVANLANYSPQANWNRGRGSSTYSGGVSMARGGSYSYRGGQTYNRGSLSNAGGFNTGRGFN